MAVSSCQPLLLPSSAFRPSRPSSPSFGDVGQFIDQNQAYAQEQMKELMQLRGRVIAGMARHCPDSLSLALVAQCPMSSDSHYQANASSMPSHDGNGVATAALGEGLQEEFRLLNKQTAEIQMELWDVKKQVGQLTLQNQELQDEAFGQYSWRDRALAQENAQLQAEISKQNQVVSNLYNTFCGAYDELLKCRPALRDITSAQGALHVKSTTADNCVSSDEAVCVAGDTEGFAADSNSQTKEDALADAEKWLREIVAKDIEAAGVAECEDCGLQKLALQIDFAKDLLQEGVSTISSPSIGTALRSVENSRLWDDAIDEETVPDALSVPPGQWMPLPPPVQPFSRQMIGANLELSPDGYTATRCGGSRQAVAIGKEPLGMGCHGWYFEVEIRDVVSGWVGGLGIGVTQTAPDNDDAIPRLPDKGWRMPRTYMAGYWGWIFCDGAAHRTMWRAEELQVGDRVGFLATQQGEMLVFVNDKQKAFLDAKVPVPTEGNGLSFFPIVDVFSATRSIVLRPCSEPPPAPWSAPSTPLDVCFSAGPSESPSSSPTRFLSAHDGLPFGSSEHSPSVSTLVCSPRTVTA